MDVRYGDQRPAETPPLGFAFSGYNALGAVQALEPIYDQAASYRGDLPTDSRVNLTTALNLDRQVRDGNAWKSEDA